MAETQVWLITGASRGLGLELTKTALKAGHKVVACYRSKAKLGATYAEIEALGGIWLQLDVVAEDVEAKVQSVVAQHGRIDVLINNAGYGMLGSLEETSIAQVEAIFKTNFFGALRTIQAALPSMRSRRSGTIVNISSSLAISPAPGFSIYSATKFATEAITESLQVELASFGIRTLLIEPGMTATEFADASGTGVEVPIGEAYQGGAVSQTIQLIQSPEFLAQAAVPAKVAQRIVEAIDRTGFFADKEVALRLPLGGDTGAQLQQRAAMWGDLAKGMKDSWMSIYL
ncbi:putative short chain oxidoreductase/dehydrogenase [Annulohypoxylon maeteangense]|uniref:putative short chain oxidoreductase/dehydrogenase n=1 Tax=Annulohypoxylon maeteangense TaxID=1927788 RepID=UPI002008C1CE|nr:putative short chain oxidoreductase/dehydrogenase [Annulohypoxylon maeteangense]KAI0887551.1 putative short chain oxidoreductase/dehydrogenase [Annulohypoxylon maeteangense]